VRGFGVRFLPGARDLSLLHNGSGAHSAFYTMGIEGGGVPAGVNLAFHLYLVPRLRIYGAISSLPHTSYGIVLN
jgi:hypothetical protein